MAHFLRFGLPMRKCASQRCDHRMHVARCEIAKVISSICMEIASEDDKGPAGSVLGQGLGQDQHLLKERACIW